MTEDEKKELRELPLAVRYVHGYADMLRAHTTHPIAVTIQPNYAHLGGGLAVRRATTLGLAPPLERLQKLVKELFYRLDRGYSGCVKPHFLPPDWRFSGFVLPEGYQTNPHVHIILSCRTPLEQMWRYWFLLWALDTAPAIANPKARAVDISNEERAWRILDRGDRPWMAWNSPDSRSKYLDDASYGRERLAPRGTAKVQLVPSMNDLEWTLVYDTKYWMSRMALQSNRFVKADDLECEFWRLSEFFSPAGINNPARCYRLNPDNSGDRLPGTGHREWRIEGGTILR